MWSGGRTTVYQSVVHIIIVIHSGAFGKVLKGTLMTGEEEQKVAIKTLKSECI